MTELSDAEVIADSWATPARFADIFDRHFGAIHRYLARRLSPADADELAGEVFRIGFEKRHGFDPSRSSALPWLYGITSNLVLKHHRREGRALRAMARERAAVVPLRVGCDWENDVDSRLDAAASHKQVVAALSRLKDDERELVLLAAFSELSYRELAEATGLSDGTVRSKLSRSKNKLRELIGPVGEVRVEPPTKSAQGGNR